MSSSTSTILDEVAAAHQPLDASFGEAYVDVDEERGAPSSHRYIHGGFRGSETRFSIYLPPASIYEGRMLQTLEGAASGQDSTVANQLVMFGGLEHALECGAFLVESNQGHIGSGQHGGASDPTLYSYRASAEVARLARALGGAAYGAPPAHTYLLGPGIGGNRAQWCLENTADVWDGAVAVAIGGLRSFTAFASVANTRRMLGERLRGVIDATSPGGSGDPFAGLSADQRLELATLYRLGFPRGAEAAIIGHNSSIAFWTLEADNVIASDPAFFDEFWTRPGYAGADGSGDLDAHHVRMTSRVRRVIGAGEVARIARESGGAGQIAFLAGWLPPDLPLALELDDEVPADARGALLEVPGTRGAGRQYILAQLGPVLMVSAFGASHQGLVGVEPGDEVHLDNTAFLAYCHYHRHHIEPGAPEFRSLTVDHVPVYEQGPLMPLGSFFAAPTKPDGSDPTSGRFTGKLILIGHTLDSSAWPGASVAYHRLVARALGASEPDRFRLWWLEHADHLPAPLMYPGERPAPDTQFIDFRGAITQALRDLIAWTELGLAPPPNTGYTYEDDCRLSLVPGVDRAGIQPVVTASANAAARCEVSTGETVELHVQAAVPRGGGMITKLEWDFDGSGTWDYQDPAIDGTHGSVDQAVSHTFDTAGTYFPAVRITAHRDGLVGATSRELVNLGRVRVVVR